MPSQKEEARIERDGVGWSSLWGDEETHAFLPILDETETYIGKK